MTYSIVARDPATGELGVAVQSHYFSSGSVVPWARPGVGAVATQASVRLDYGPRGLELMAGGMGAATALESLRAADEGSAQRQVAIVDGAGATAAFTGAECVSFASDRQADGVSCQANIMAREGVPEAMLEAFVAASSPPTSLAARLLAALVAAEAAGGDLRGRQSAGLLVVPGSGDPWQTVVSLRVDDDPEPLDELARLLRVKTAYRAAGEAHRAAEAGDPEAALVAHRRACELAGDHLELRFQQVIGLYAAGEEDEAVAAMRALCAEAPRWREVLARWPELAAGRLLKRL